MNKILTMKGKKNKTKTGMMELDRDIKRKPC
jgi:hypothetical protein